MVENNYFVNEVFLNGLTTDSLKIKSKTFKFNPLSVTAAIWQPNDKCIFMSLKSSNDIMTFW